MIWNQIPLSLKKMSQLHNFSQLGLDSCINQADFLSVLSHPDFKNPLQSSKHTLFLTPKVSMSQQGRI